MATFVIVFRAVLHVAGVCVCVCVCVLAENFMKNGNPHFSRHKLNPLMPDGT